MYSNIPACAKLRDPPFAPFLPLASYSYPVCLLAGHFTEREQNQILGHSGSAIFEKYYHDNRIHRDIQNVVLPRASLPSGGTNEPPSGSPTVRLVCGLIIMVLG
jgi:Protein of unknown function (DUF3435)